MISDDEKERLKILIELHKENADLMKSVLTSLTALLTVFGLAAVAVLSVRQDFINPISINLGKTSQTTTLPTDFSSSPGSNVAYMVFGVLLLQNFFLRETMLRSGYQKRIEEMINDICKKPTAFTNLFGGISPWSPCNIGFNAFTTMILIFAIEKGLWPAAKEWYSGKDIIPTEFLATQIILLAFLFFGYIEIFTARERAYQSSLSLFEQLAPLKDKRTVVN